MTKQTFLTNTTSSGVPVACRVTSITLSTDDSGDGILKLSAYNQTVDDAKVAVVSGTFNTVQAFFDGLPFPNGFTLHGDAGLLMAVVEYVPI